MRWEHQVNEAWLEARKTVITSTELKSLLPEVKRIRKGAAYDVAPCAAALWERKNGTYYIPEYQTQEMTRGHVLEPWCIWALNDVGFSPYHWDDCIIKNYGVGFSPDGLDVPQDYGDSVSVDAQDMHKKPKVIYEIKSYKPENHIKAILEKDKMKHEERLQIAVGMLVLPSVETGYLCFYNPGVKHMLYVEEYTREELKKDIEDMEECLSLWNKTCRQMQTLEIDGVYENIGDNEAEILEFESRNSSVLDA